MASLLLACSDEGRDGLGGSKRVCRMVFDGAIQGFDSSTRAGGVSLQQGAVMYLALDNQKTTATYDGSEWLVTVPDGLADGAKGSCTAYYIENPSTTSGTSVKLTSGSVVFSGTGTYTNSTDAFTVSATLTPLTSRVRFRGESGTQVTVSGLQGYSSFDTSSYALAATTSALTLTVQSDGSTPYVYALPTSARTLAVSDGVYTYTRTLDAGVMQKGHSGYFDIPTPDNNDNWTKEIGNPFIYEYVDLGLSVKWATCNVGASSPEDYGDYFAWGETKGYMDGKTIFNWDTYKWMEDGYSDGGHINKYQYADGQTSAIWYKNGTFVGDNKTVLDLEDDVAHVKWGGSWRMPTDAEFTELRNNCTWTWTIQNGVEGRKVTSKTNGNSIFLPNAGYRNNSSFYNAGSYGQYRSSSLYSSSSDYAYVLYFSSGNAFRNYSSRDLGQSVRPVWAEDVKVSSIVVTTSKSEINMGESLQLFAEVSPSNATNKKVIWSSNNTNVATVSADGLVTAKQLGTVTITATATDGSGVKGAYTLKVVSPYSSTGNYEYVDLGLSVKWATCNVGASSPEDYGDYFAWGETMGYLEGKTYFYWDTYKWMEDGYSDWRHVNKYQYADGETSAIWYKNGTFVGDNKIVLDPEDDVVHVKWGGEWRMPTDAEFTELRENCTWTWTTQNGVYGCKVTSKTNGNSIFLPAAGYRLDSYFYFAGSYGLYWSSSLYTSYSNDAYGLYFLSGSGNRSHAGRCVGRSVRPVCP